MLSGKKLSKRYPSAVALEDVSIDIAAGQICGLLGRNGAGKTTLFRILCGLIKPDSGSLSIQSSRKKPVGGIIEQPGLYPYLNAQDNIRIFAGIQGADTSKGAIDEILLKVGLPITRKDPVRNFSLGMKQRLGIAIALINNPECLVLDEPFSGLDPVGVSDLINLIVKLAKEDQIAVLLSSHMMGEITRCCDTLYIIEQGRIVNYGPTNELIEAHITSYSISARNINSSQNIRKYPVEFGPNDARVNCKAEQIPLLLQGLLNEGILVSSCLPIITLEELTKNPAHDITA